MIRVLLSFVLIHFVFSGLYLFVSNEFSPKINSFGDSVYYSLQTMSRVGDGQFTAIGVWGRLVTMIQVYVQLVWFVLSLIHISEPTRPY